MENEGHFAPPPAPFSGNFPLIDIFYSLCLPLPIVRSRIHSPPPRIFAGCHHHQILNSGGAPPALFILVKSENRAYLFLL